MAVVASQYGGIIRLPSGRNLAGIDLCSRRRTNNRRMEVCSSLHTSMNKPMRNIVEHVVLLQMKENFTEEQEETMLDNLYTLQYYFRGILCISLGRLISENQEHCTHGIVMRFASKDLLVKYNDHPAHIKVAREFVLPYCNGFITADFEAEVEDSLEPLFRRGEEFEIGVEHIILLKVGENTSPDRVREMLQSVLRLAENLAPILVQITAGNIFSADNQGYTHAIVARFPSEDALEAFNKHGTYVSVVSEKIIPVCSKILSTDFRVEPIGTTIQQ